MPAGYFDYLSCKESCPLTCQKQNRVSNVFRLNQLSHGNYWDGVLCQLTYLGMDVAEYVKHLIANPHRIRVK